MTDDTDLDKPLHPWGPTLRILEQLRGEELEQRARQRGPWPPTIYVGVHFHDGSYGIVSPLDWDPSWADHVTLLVGLHNAVQWAAKKGVVKSIPDQLDEKQIDQLLKTIAKRSEDRSFMSLDDLVDDSGAD